MANSAVLQVFTLPLPYWPVWSQELPESSRVQRHDQNSHPHYILQASATRVGSGSLMAPKEPHGFHRPALQADSPLLRDLALTGRSPTNCSSVAKKYGILFLC